MTLRSFWKIYQIQPKNGMGIVADVDLLAENDLEYIKITVNSYTFPISYNGKYFYRSGSTTFTLSGASLDEFMLKKQGVTWDGVPIPNETIDNFDNTAIKVFKEKALKSRRLDEKALDVPDEILFQNLQLYEGNYLKRAAVLLFHENPEKWIQGAYIKIGFFGSSDSDLIYQDEIHGPLILQIDEAMKIIYQKYMKALIDYEGIQRTENYMFPIDGFREILLNAVNHKDYARGIPIQISVYDDKIYVWNDGKFPETLTADNIYDKHSSIPFNPKVADTLFKAGMIESWGRGFDKIKEECISNDTPLPEYEVSERGIMVKCLPSEKYMSLAKKHKIISQNDSENGSTPQVTPQVTPQANEKWFDLIEFCKEPKTRVEMQAFMKLKDKKNFVKNYINPMLESGLLEMTEPDKPKSSNQKYIAKK